MALKALLNIPYPVMEASGVWACEVCDQTFFSYEEAKRHEDACDKIKPLAAVPKQAKQLKESFKFTSKSVDTGLQILTHAPSKTQKNKQVKPKPAKETTQNNFSRVGSVPLRSTLTKRKADDLDRLQFILVDNLELYERTNADGNSYIVLQCSNCYGHSIRLGNKVALEEHVVDFKGHFETCSSTLKSTRDEIKSLQRSSEISKDKLKDYCSFIQDLYGWVDSPSINATTDESRGETSVQWGECRYILIEGYTPATVEFTPKVISRPFSLVHPTRPSTSNSDSPAKPLVKASQVLSDYDHFILTQFQLICDRIYITAKESDGSNKFCKVQVCCKSCQAILPKISSVYDFMSSKPFLSHLLHDCHSFPADLKNKLAHLDALKERQMKEITEIVPLRDYTLKVIQYLYEIRDSGYEGMVVRCNPFPEALKFASIPFAFPVIMNDIVQPASLLYPPPTAPTIETETT